MEQAIPRNFVGATIRKLRMKRNWTQEILAGRCQLVGCDLSRGTLAKIEAEIRSVNDLELLAIAHVFGIKIEELFPKGLLARIRSEQKSI